MDEAFSHLFATLPLNLSWQAMIVDAVHPPLYYLLLRPWLALAGDGEFALRFPSALAGVLTVALSLQVGRDWLGERAGVWAAFLLALNPYHVWYSQEARMYALLGLLSLAVLAAFWRVLRRRRRGDWAILGALSALAYVTHYFALYLPLIEFIFLLSKFRRYHRALARWAVVQALAVLPLAGWLTALYATAGGTFGIGWIPAPRLVDPLLTLWSFGMAYDGRLTLGVVAGLAMWGGALVLGMWRGLVVEDAKLFLILSLALPLLVTLLLSLRRPTYVDRFFIGSLPAFVGLAAVGLVRLPRPALCVVGLALAGLGIWGVARFHLDPMFAKEDWRAAARYVEARERTGDALALRYFQHVVPFGYYYRGELEPQAVTVNRVTTPVEGLASGYGRLWLVLRARHGDPHHLAWSEPFDPELDEANPVVRKWIAFHQRENEAAYSGVSVLLFDLERRRK
jgi:4-amino-4-deoxy-L-arabinose transferase-like glycosyltransferase